MSKTKLTEAKTVLAGSQRILIVSHVRPDGDAVGSLLGLGLALRDADKKVQMILADGVPKTFRHLHGSQLIQKKPDGEFDTIVALDSSDLDRLGDFYKHLPSPDINIDHHITNQHFAKINLVDTKASATAEMLTGYLPVLGYSISKPAAEALLTGIITDTIGFRTSNMRPETLRTAADLMSMGIDLPALYMKALHSRSFEAARYWGAGLSTLKKNQNLVWATLKLDDRKSIKYPGNDDADLVNILTTIEDVDIAIVFIEQTGNKVKVSWRARPGFDVSKIAAQFGGGGHKPAAGATIEGNLDQVQASVLKSTQTLINESTT
jgi:phosphoesterase RecJ-like protein